MTDYQALRILNRMEEAGLISGHDFIDDGPDEPEGERYWGNIYIDGWACEAAMSDDPQAIRPALIYQAFALVLQDAGWTVTEGVTEGVVAHADG